MIYPLVCGHDSWWGVEQGAVNGARRVAFRMNEEGSDHLPPPRPKPMLDRGLVLAVQEGEL